MIIRLINDYDNTNLQAFTVDVDMYGHVSKQIILPRIGETIISPSTKNKFLVTDIQYAPHETYDRRCWFCVTHATDINIICHILPGNENEPDLSKTI